jgi:hypothetical protein
MQCESTFISTYNLLNIHYLEKHFKTKGVDPKGRYMFRPQKFFAHEAVFEEVGVNFD